MDRAEARLLDIGSIAVAGSTLAGWLPAIAAALSIVWLLIRIWESRTVRGLTGRDTTRPTED